VTPPAPARCPWCLGAPEYIAYHDDEWGVPAHDDAHLFEMLTLEGAQAGLSWLTILRKREGYRRAFAGFDADRVARFTKRDVTRLLADASIVRHRGKIESTISNAQRILEVRTDLGSLDSLVWSFVGNKPMRTARSTMADVPATSPESEAMSRALKKRGFRFVGSTTCYAFMQACGLVDDHLTGCFRAGGRR